MKPVDPLVDVAAAISDGAPVEWTAVEKAADRSRAGILRHLRIVERIASVHAGVPSPGACQRPLDESRLSTELPEPERQPIRWGPLTITRLIAGGTCAEVYLARDPRLDRPVALKLLRRRDASEDESIDEARLLARVQHPNVVTVYGAERIDGRTGIWMEYLDGCTLEQEFRDRGRFSATEIIEVGITLCSALEAVHAAGLLHRDVKPQNVMRDRRGRLVLTDFGAGRETSRMLAREIAGTPMYLAPEVLDGGAATAAADLYSAGITLYRLATGSFPVVGRSIPDLQDAHARNARTPVRAVRAELPRVLASVIDRAIDVSPSARYSSARAFRSALESLRSRPRAASPVAIVSVTAVVMVLVGSLFVGRFAAVPGRAPVQQVSTQWVLVSDAENGTGDAALTGSVAAVLGRALETSQRVAIVPGARVHEVLKLMRRPPDSRLDPRLALEVAARAGDIAGVGRTRVEPSSPGYSVTVEIDDSSTRETVVSETGYAATRDLVVDTVRAAAARLRAELDDATATWRHDSSKLEPVTTSSLSAVRLYSDAVRFGNEGRWTAAAALARQALREDPQFASAHAWLGWALRNSGASDEAPDEFARAAALADAVTPRERGFILGSYYQTTGRPADARRAYESALAADPNDFWTANNLAVTYEQLGNRDMAIRALSGDASGVMFPALYLAAESLVTEQGNVATARPLVARALSARTPDRPRAVAWLRLFHVHDQWLSGRVREASEELDAVAPQLADPLLLATWNLTLGRMRTAEAIATAGSDADSKQAAALVAFARGDMAALRARLATLEVDEISRISMTGVLLHTAGLDTQLDALVRLSQRRMATGALPASPVTRRALNLLAVLASGDGRGIEAAAADNLAVATAGSADYFLTLETLARQRTRPEQLPGMARLLEQAGPTRARTHGYESTGYFWLRTRAQLARIYRQFGRDREAAAIEAELRQALAAADADFSPLHPFDAPMVGSR